MMFKTGCFFITLLVGSIAFPVNEEEDMSFFFDQPIIEPFIIGGTVADDVPHMVALTRGIFMKMLFCGASIINERFVLTAAHCIRGVVSGNAILRNLRGNIGSNRWLSSSIEHTFSRAINHPDYNSHLIKNDIGFLVTSSAIVFTDKVKPVVLNFDFIGGEVEVIANGWGSNVYGGPASQVLMELRPLTVEGQRCIDEVTRVSKEQNIPAPAVDPKVELCTFFKSTTGMCHGDSGSALIHRESKQQIGVVSWGIPCARGAPDMFARVSAYKSWIEEQLR